MATYSVVGTVDGRAYFGPAGESDAAVEVDVITDICDVASLSLADNTFPNSNTFAGPVTFDPASNVTGLGQKPDVVIGTMIFGR